MASMSRGFNTRANESGSSESWSLSTDVAPDFAAAVCFRNWPIRTKFSIEYSGFEAGLDRVALAYSSRIWCSSLRTVLPTVCSVEDQFRDIQATGM